MRSLVPILHRLACPAVVVWALLVAPGGAAAADRPGAPIFEPVALRAESLTVPPSSQPLVFVAVKNLLEVPYQGTVVLKVPQGWQIAPAKREVSLAPGETKRLPFSLERGVSTKANSYPIEVAATGSGATVVCRQKVACASAPYFKPTIDGKPDEWNDAIPITFTSGGKKTVISTYWNKRQFSLLVAVEEEKLIGYREQPTPGGFDAVQVAISPQDAETGTSADDEATRYEFLFVSTGSGTFGRCFQLAQPGMKLAEAAEVRSLERLEYEQAKLAVSRIGGWTYYECGVPFSLMRERIRPSEGREFCMSVLVHDPDGTGIRDWGEAAGLWPWQRNPLAWSRFAGAKWGQKPPFDNKLRWGLCSSKY